MEQAEQQYKLFQRKCHSQSHEIIKVQQIQSQINKISKLLNDQQLSEQLLPSDKYDIQTYIKVYKVAMFEIEKMKSKFIKPSAFRERLAYIFDNKIDQIHLENNHYDKSSSEIRDSEVDLEKPIKKSRQNAIDANHQSGMTSMNSTELRNFFVKKQNEVSNKSITSTGFRDILKNDRKHTPHRNRSINRSNNRSTNKLLDGSSISKGKPESKLSSQSSRDCSYIFKKRPDPEIQLKKVLEENRKIKQQYDIKMRQELQLTEFQKNLLKEQKNRYMLKIEQLQTELENMYRQNYKLKEKSEFSKEKKVKTGDMTSFQSANERSLSQNQQKYYEPYAMRVKPNNLKLLNQKNQTEIDPQQRNNDSQVHSILKDRNLGMHMPQVQGYDTGTSPMMAPPKCVDLLGNQLDKQLEQLQKSSNIKPQSNVSVRSSSKKWSRQYNKNVYPLDQSKKQENSQVNMSEIFNTFDNIDEKQSINIFVQNPGIGSKKINSPNQNNNNFLAQSSKPSYNKEFVQRAPKLPKPSIANHFREPQHSQEQTSNVSLKYKPASDYSFTRNIGKNGSTKQYSVTSNGNSFDTFSMTRTYLDLNGINDDSNVNRYIDSHTSTRNKVAFFKDSLILIKKPSFQVAMKKSSLVKTKDRIRILFFIKNKSSIPLNVSINYQFDAGYYKLKTNQKIQIVPAGGQSREDTQVYSFSSKDLNQVIDVLVEVNGEKFGLWLPVLWIQFEDKVDFKMPNYNEQTTIIPDRQFKNYQTAKAIMPLMFGGIEGNSEWAYLYGKCKFGSCHVKFTWESNQLRIETNAKWIDLLAFVMHHVK